MRPMARHSTAPPTSTAAKMIQKLWPVRSPEAVQTARLANIAAMAAKLRAAGVTLFSEPARVPAGVVKFAAGDKTLVYFLDPDGVILELAEYR